MITTLLLVTALTLPGTDAPRAVGDRPKVKVWTNNSDSPYHRGDAARVFARAEDDGYLTLIRVDTDGRLRVLFPRQPWDDNFVRGGEEIEVQGGPDETAFAVDDDPGVGYVFAVVAVDPFDFDGITVASHWDYRAMDQGRITGDPYVALTDLAGRIAPAGDDEWDYDLVPYYVEQHYDYPRFVCYNCHGYNAWSTWNPYATVCDRYRVVVYDDPYYYPYRYHGGTQVVVERPYRPEPRFVFKDRDGSPKGPFITVQHRDDRPMNDDRRRQVPSVDPRGRPDKPPRNGGGENHGGGNPGRGRPDQPSRPDHPDHPDRPDRPSRADHQVSWERPAPRPSQPSSASRPASGSDHRRRP